MSGPILCTVDGCPEPAVHMKRCADHHGARLAEQRAARGVLGSGRARYLARNYDLTPEAYAEMVVAQGGRCAICREPAELRVDHDHATGIVRGLLCDGCNVALGLMDDDRERLLAAIFYLKRHSP